MNAKLSLILPNAMQATAGNINALIGYIPLLSIVICYML